MLGYIGRHLAEIRAAINHTDFEKLKKDQYPKWWTEMRAAFQKEADDWKRRHGGRYSYNSGKTRPLYTDAENCDVTFKFVLTSLLLGSMVGNHNLEMIARLMQSWDAFARGGNIKFQELKEWIFDPILKLQTRLGETKTLDFYAMARVFNPNFWGVCFYFTFGAFVMCEGGLQRTIK